MVNIRDKKSGHRLIAGDLVMVEKVVRDAEGAIDIVVYKTVDAVFRLSIRDYLNFTRAV